MYYIMGFNESSITQVTEKYVTLYIDGINQTHQSITFIHQRFNLDMPRRMTCAAARQSLLLKGTDDKYIPCYQQGVRRLQKSVPK